MPAHPSSIRSPERGVNVSECRPDQYAMSHPLPPATEHPSSTLPPRSAMSAVKSSAPVPAPGRQMLPVYERPTTLAPGGALNVCVAFEPSSADPKPAFGVTTMPVPGAPDAQHVDTALSDECVVDGAHEWLVPSSAPLHAPTSYAPARALDARTSDASTSINSHRAFTPLPHAPGGTHRPPERPRSAPPAGR